MFARVKKSGKYQYLQIVENHKEKGKVGNKIVTLFSNMFTDPNLTDKENCYKMF